MIEPSCRFIGVTADTLSFYEGIDYDALARDLYDATLDRWGTDEKKVYEVFTKAVGIPLMRLMPEQVRYSTCATGACSTAELEYHENFFLIERFWYTCHWPDGTVGPNGAEGDIASRATDRLERSLALFMEKNGKTPKTLEQLLLAEMGEDQKDYLLSPDKYKPWPRSKSHVTCGEFEGWLRSGATREPNESEIAAMSAVGTFFPVEDKCYEMNIAAHNFYLFPISDGGGTGGGLL
jgi:hypothetical protein